MTRALPAAVAVAVIAVAGLLHGRMTDRWSKSTDVADAVGRLGRIPAEIGGRKGAAVELDPEALKRGGIDGYYARRFADPRGGPAVSVLVVCGRPGPISVHTPDICYAGAGYLQTGPADRESLAPAATNPAADLARAVFVKSAALTASDLQISWSWFDGRSWQAPTNPRLTFAPRKALYKLYLIRELSSKSDVGPISPFERDALAALQTALASGH